MAFARQCERCKRVTAPRGDVTPRYCAYCGARLSGGPMETPRGQRDRSTSGWAVTALILALAGPLLFFLMLPLGLMAVACSLGAHRAINRSDGQLAGARLADVGFVLGVIECFLGAGFCARVL